MSNSNHNLLTDLFLKHAHELSVFLRGRWPRENDIDDIVQEAYLRLYQTPNPEVIFNPRAFLFTTASHVVVDRHRRQQTRDRYIDSGISSENIANNQLCPARHSEAYEALDRFTTWLDELPELTRHVFVLFRIEGCSHTEIGLRLGISVSSSERHVKKAMNHFSEHMGDVIDYN